MKNIKDKVLTVALHNDKLSSQRIKKALVQSYKERGVKIITSLDSKKNVLIFY